MHLEDGCALIGVAADMFLGDGILPHDSLDHGQTCFVAAALHRLEERLQLLRLLREVAENMNGAVIGRVVRGQLHGRNHFQAAGFAQFLCFCHTSHGIMVRKGKNIQSAAFCVKHNVLHRHGAVGQFGMAVQIAEHEQVLLQSDYVFSITRISEIGKGEIFVGTSLNLPLSYATLCTKEACFMWFVLALLSAVFAALTSILAKIGIDGVNSNLATAIRTMVVVAMAWGMVFLTNSQSGISHISSKSWLFLVLSGLATGASWLCYYRALQIGEASKVVPVDKLSVVITLVLAFVFLHEKFTIKSLIGCALIGGGTLLMVL